MEGRRREKGGRREVENARKRRVDSRSIWVV
jgi:hypothetical protein